jgi:ABC-2 type transport system ATP-binding protein
MIEIVGMTKRFGSRVAVDDLSLSVKQGEVYGFLGSNGAGKTTTIRTLLGILEPDAGRVSVCGRPVRRGDRVGRCLVGAVGEVQHLYGDMSCQSYLGFFASLFGIDRPMQRVAEVLETVGLSDRSDDLAVGLSKGLQQKLGLARALLHRPPVLILDEPISGLDPHGVREVREIISKERDRGRLIFFSSHVLSEVALIASRIGIMRQGKLLFEGTIDAVLSRHATLEEAFIAITGQPAPATGPIS